MSKKETKKSNEVNDEKNNNNEEKIENNEKSESAVNAENTESAECTEKDVSSSESGEIQALKKEISELKDKNLRLMAEFENYKRRTRQEKESTYEFALSDAVKNIIPVLDTLELSVKNETNDGKAFRQGIELIVKNFKDTLAKMGVTPIEALGQPFDPELHNAVMSADEGDEESGVITEEFQKGYKLNEKVIRHSMVKVKA